MFAIQVDSDPLMGVVSASLRALQRLTEAMCRGPKDRLKH